MNYDHNPGSALQVHSPCPLGWSVGSDIRRPSLTVRTCYNEAIPNGPAREGSKCGILDMWSWYKDMDFLLNCSASVEDPAQLLPN